MLIMLTVLVRVELVELEVKEMLAMVTQAV